MNDILKEAVGKLISQMGDEVPELKAILDSAKGGELSEQEAMAELMRTVQENPELAAKFTNIASEAFKPTRQMVPQPKAELAEVGDDAFWSGVGLPKMNPLVEAALIERVQFDGDMPELRTGPAPEGIIPAMPVKTKARSAVAIGTMMDEASSKIRKSLDEGEKKRAKAIERVAEAKRLIGERTADAKEATNKALAKVGEARDKLAKLAEQDVFAIAHSEEFDPPEYKRGELPAPMEVATPSGAALIKMTKDEQREAVWRFISTSQGRRTALETLRTIIFNGLGDIGVPVELREYNPKKPTQPFAFHQWTVNLSGRGGVQPAYNIIDTAAQAITKALSGRVELEDEKPEKLFLEVIPVDTVDIRRVGWAARLVAPEG